MTTAEKLKELFQNFVPFILEKNKRYGDSATNPVQIFSRLDPGEPICSRLDEKIQRIMNAEKLKKNDVADMLGYLSLLMAKKGWTHFDEFLD